METAGVEPAIRRIVRVGVGSAFRVGAVLSALAFAVLGIFFVVLPSLFGASLFGALSGGRAGGGLALGGGLLFYILGIVFYAIFGGVFSALYAWLYNLVAGWIGGIVVELD